MIRPHDDLRAVAREMKERRVNGRNHSPTLWAWADRIEAAARELEGEQQPQPPELHDDPDDKPPLWFVLLVGLTIALCAVGPVLLAVSSGGA